MNEQFEKIVNKINRISSRLFAPVLGKIGFYKEKRISIELNKDSITICRVNVKKKIITHLFNRSFDLTDPDTNLEKKPKFYSDEIAEILAKEKLLGFEANIIIPTSDVSIKSMSVPIMDQDIMDQQVKNPEFWKQFGDLPNDMNDKTIFHQIINSNKVTNMHDILLVFTDKKKFENLNIILKNAGLNPTLYEPKCFSILNTIFAIQKNKEPKPFAFLEYGEKENYFALCSKNKLIFYENPIRKEDLVLIKQMAKLTDITGPFWGEVFDRHLQVVKAGLSEVKGIKEFEIKDIYVHSEFSETNNFIDGLQKKLTDVTFKELTVFDQDVSKLKKSKSTMKLKLFKFDKQTEERIKSSHDKNTSYYANIGASFRFLNPYNIQEPIRNFFKVNLHHFHEIIIRNRKIKIQNYLINLITISFLILFSSIIAFNIPQYIKNARIVNNHQKVIQLHDSIYEDIKNKKILIEEIKIEKQLAQKILGKKKDEFAKLMLITPSMVPSGILIKKIEYKRADYAVYHGSALSDIDLNTFLERLKKNLGRSELTTMNETVITISEESNFSQIQGNASEFDDSISSDQSLNNLTIKAKSFSITVNLSET